MKQCSIKGCHKPYWETGFCSMHYARERKYGDPNHISVIFHGLRKSSEYNSWCNIRSRCLNKKDPAYSQYGGRGITVCNRWLGIYGFVNFYEDMGPRPNTGYSIDRINNNKGYYPSNCRWATRHQQTSNRRSSNQITGVHYDVQYDRWFATLRLDGVLVLRKAYKDIQKAIDARLEAEDIYLKGQGINC